MNTRAKRTATTNPLIELWGEYSKGDRQLTALPTRLNENFKHKLLTLLSSQEFEGLVKRQLGSDDMHRIAGYKDVMEWLTVAGGLRSPLLRAQHSNVHKTLVFLLFMDLLKRGLQREIHEVLEPRVKSGELPEKGTLLAFTSALAYAYIVEFDFKGGWPDIQIIDRIKRPLALFDLRHFPELRSQRAKNAAKRFLTSGHKIIIHGGVLTHVDRRLDRGVFGPTIDTIILAEEALSATEETTEGILEIGCGNGHIVSYVSARISSIRTAVFIDVNPHATTCTLRNLRANLAMARLPVQPDLQHCYGVTGPFNLALPFGQRFDLVISNPPYIALRPGLAIGDARAASVAVTGTNLLEEIVRSAQHLLTQNGRMLIMISSTSGDAVRRALPDGFRASNGKLFDKVSVPFDVEDVLDHPEWLVWLTSEGMVTKRGNEFFHNLIPTWIQRSI